MVCQRCRKAGNLARHPERVLPGELDAGAMHAKCRGGTWCDCQHEVHVIVDAERLTGGRD